MSPRRAVLAAVLATTGLAGTAQAHSGATWGGAQHRHVKGSRICRFRIVKRRVGSGFKVTAKTGSERAGDLTGGTVDVMVGGEVLETLQLDTPVNGRVITRGPTLASEGVPVSVTFEAPVLDDAGAPIGETEVITLGIEAIGYDDVTVESERGWQVTARLTQRGRLRAVITHSDVTWAGGGIERVGHQVDSPELSPLAIHEIRQRWAGRLRSDLSEHAQVTVATAFTDATGGPVAAQIGAHALVEGALVPGLVDARLGADRDGHAVLEGWTRSEGGPTTLAATLVDFEVEAPVAEAEARPHTTQRTFLTDPMAFDPGEAPTQAPYLVLLDLLGPDGEPLAGQHELDVYFPEAITDGAWHSQAQPFADGAGQFVAINGPEGYQFQITWAGAGAGTMTGVNTLFEEPYEGPAPLETEVRARPIVQWDAWSLPLEAELPALSAVTTTLRAADGAVLATDGFTLAGAGATTHGVAPAAGCTTQGDVQVCTADPLTRALRAPAAF